MYELPPFEETFQPMKHNKYLMRRNDVVSRFVTLLLVTCHVCHVCRYSTSQGYYQQAAHTLAQADQTRLMAERLGAAFTWGRAIYEGCLIGQGIETSQALYQRLSLCYVRSSRIAFLSRYHHHRTSLLLRSRH